MAGTSSLLEIDLLGSPRIFVNGQAAQGLRRKNRALLYYLAGAGKSVRRETVLALFWPDYERATSQPILRTMIHDLRRELGEAIRVEDHSLSLSGSTLIDARRLCAAVDSPHPEPETLSTALALYQGDFLEGFSLEDGSQFDDWTASERERYRLTAIRGHTRLAKYYEEQQEYSSALEHMRRALAFNVLQEDLQREVMRLLYLNGDRTGVVRQYDSLLKLLDEEMGMLPMAETRKLYDAILRDEGSPPAVSIQASRPEPASTSDSVLPFLGREA